MKSGSISRTLEVNLVVKAAAKPKSMPSPVPPSPTTKNLATPRKASSGSTTGISATKVNMLYSTWNTHVCQQPSRTALQSCIHGIYRHVWFCCLSVLMFTFLLFLQLQSTGWASAMLRWMEEFCKSWLQNLKYRHSFNLKSISDEEWNGSLHVCISFC